MRILIFAALVLSCGGATAQQYSCPPLYPGSHAVPLTGATMQWGERDGDGILKGDSEPVKGGSDNTYAFPDDEKKWLLCSYGSQKRIKGQLINGTEWGQYMEWSDRQVWWMQLDPNVLGCDLQIREVKSRGLSKSTWTATAICSGKELPSPHMPE